jgi:hypothetical protein
VPRGSLQPKSRVDISKTIRADGQAPSSLKLFGSVPAILELAPLIDAASWFFLGE